jgi:hypothetical protein
MPKKLQKRLRNPLQDAEAIANNSFSVLLPLDGVQTNI